jgi:Mrp family chromosome partitioning ATPase
MGMSEILWAARRHWRVVIGVFVLALAVGWVTTPSQASVKDQQRQDVSYKATNTMTFDGSTSESLDRFGLLATVGKIPADIRRALGDTPLPASEATVNPNSGTRHTQIGSTSLTVTPDKPAAALRIGATDKDAKRATYVANTVATRLSLAAALDARELFVAAKDALNQNEASLQAKEKDLRNELDAALASNSPAIATLDQQHQDALHQLRDNEAQLQHLSANEPSGTPLGSLERGVPIRVVTTTGGIKTPTDPFSRLLLAGLIGIALGLGIALLLNRHSEAVYGVPSIEAATMLPVICEVPYINAIGRRRYDVLAQVVPASRVAESYRGLRTSISLMWVANSSREGEGDQISIAADQPEVLMLASPGPSEGKSTSTANLAACYAETGKRVVIVDLDQRRQKLHRFVGAEPDPHMGSGDADEAEVVDIDSLLQETTIPNVQFVSSAPRDLAPAEATAEARRVIAALRGRADVILVDTPPLLLTNAAYDLLNEADAMVLMVRDGYTKRTAAARATQMLRRLDAPVLGVCVVGAVSTRRGYGYGYGYGYGGYGYGYGDDEADRNETKSRTIVLPREHVEEAQRERE